MPLFQYRAITQEGKKIKNYISAESLFEAKNKLHNEELILTKITPVSKKASKTRLTKSEILIFTKELAKLLRAGLPLFESFLALEEKYRGQKTHKVLLEMIDDIKQGSSFSMALSKHKENFDDLYISMIENAEKSASLESVLEELANLMEKQSILKKQVISAVTYPALLSIFALTILCVLLFFIVPSLFELFEDRELHSFTKFVIALSNWAVASKSFLFGGALLLIFGLGGALFFKKPKEMLSRISLHIPFLKHLFIKMAFIRFCRSSSTLLFAGVSLVETLSLSKRVMKQPILERAMETAKKGILEGRGLSEELNKSSLIPKLVIRMLGIAEESGKTPEMMQHISEIYEEEVEKNLQQLTSFLQPILLLFIGFIVGFVLLSVLLPLTDVSSFAVE